MTRAIAHNYQWLRTGTLRKSRPQALRTAVWLAWQHRHSDFGFPPVATSLKKLR